jgi:hypothetical protein
MVSGRTIQLIEHHHEEIGRRIVYAVRQHPELTHFRALSDLELHERAGEILENLGHWLGRGNAQELARHYEAIARERFKEGIPLHETAEALLITRDKMIEFLDEQGTDRDWVALYSEEQFERRVGHFFDLLLMHLIRGYETAWRHAASLTA